MNKTLTIPKTISADLGPNYDFLRKEGLRYVQQLSSKLWTDYNTHDPGITMLEMLCYAITDLGYRIALPMEDLITGKGEKPADRHRQFLSAIKALPSNPLTANDYRQLFVRIHGVRNAWILPDEKWVVATFGSQENPGAAKLHYRQPEETIDPEKETEFPLGGLNRILIDYDLPALLSEEEKQLPEDDQKTLLEERKTEVSQRVMAVYQRYRNLCEDISSIGEIPQQGIVLCGEIELEATADSEQVWAKIMFNISQYLAPQIAFYDMEDLLEEGKTTDEIFDGPAFAFDDDYPWRKGADPFHKKGFLKKEELKKSQLRKEVRLSDLIRIIMATPGVKLVKELSIGLANCNDPDVASVRSSVTGDEWNLCLPAGHKPVICQRATVVNIWKDVVLVRLNMTEARQQLDELFAEQRTLMQSRFTRDLEIPEGIYRNPAHYHSFQNQFPETYGIGLVGLPDSASTARKSQALQLKAYLLFFEQVLANYFSQLANARELLALDSPIRQTYFANVVNELRDAEKIFTGSGDWKKEVNELLKDTGLDNYVSRRNQFLDHLLARFSEQFNEYTFLLYRIYGENAQRLAIRHKSAFLKDYHQMSTTRGSGFDYYNPLPDEMQLTNVTGMEKRISRLLGFNTYKKISLADPLGIVEQTGTVTLASGKEIPVYGWKIMMDDDVIFESINQEFQSRDDAGSELGLASMLGCERENYKMILQGEDPKASFALVDRSLRNGSEGKEIARHPQNYDLLENEYEENFFSEAESKIKEIIDYLIHDFRLEGMYVAEHILLRPGTDEAGPDLFMPVCIESNGNHCRPLDPYTFRLTVILPGYTLRLRNTHFRRYAERLIRMETPAHILPRICFVSREHLQEFEQAWDAWFTERIQSDDPVEQSQDTTLKHLIEVIERLFTIYEQGRLKGCEDEDEETENNRIILGSSKLGSLENEPGEAE